MAIAIRGTTPVTTGGTGAISVTANGTHQPQANDVLLIIHGNDYYNLTNMSTPTVGGSTTGVLAVTNGTADGGNLFAHIKSWYYVVGSAGDLTIAAVETGAADEEKCLAVYVLSGVDNVNPIDVANNNFDSGGATVNRVCLGVTTGFDNDLLILHTNDGNGASGGPYTWPGGTTEQYDANVAGFMSYSGATEALGAAGATGNRTATATGNASYATVTIAVREAAGAAGASPDTLALVVPPPAVTRASRW